MATASKTHQTQDGPRWAKPTTTHSHMTPRPPKSHNPKLNLKPRPRRSETHGHLIWNPQPCRFETTTTLNRSWERENPHHERKRGESVRQRGEKIEERGIWKVRGRETVWEIKKLIFFYKLMNSKSIHISLAKFFGLFYTKNLLFLFYATIFPKHTHQFIYFTIYSI